nr:hypothetical protein [uncultured Methanoregula sp.]
MDIMTYFQRVLSVLRSQSQNSNGTSKQIFSEWEMVLPSLDNGEDPSNWSNCTLCGKSDCRFVFTIRNKITNVRIDGVGSKCINRFLGVPLEETNSEKRRILEESKKLKRDLFFVELLGRSSKYDTPFIQSLQEFHEGNGYFSTRQMNSILDKGEIYKLGVPVGIFNINFQRPKFRDQKNSQEFKRIYSYLTPQQQKKYAKFKKTPV